MRRRRSRDVNWDCSGIGQRLAWLAVRVGGRFCDGSGVSYICATREGWNVVSQSVSQSIRHVIVA